jgi:hypothetical protein
VVCSFLDVLVGSCHKDVSLYRIAEAEAVVASCSQEMVGQRPCVGPGAALLFSASPCTRETSGILLVPTGSTTGVDSWHVGQKVEEVGQR